MRIKFVKMWKHYQPGEVVVIDRPKALGLIKSGIAVMSKDMTPDDYNTASISGDKQAGDKDGSTTELRAHHGI